MMPGAHVPSNLMSHAIYMHIIHLPGMLRYASVSLLCALAGVMAGGQIIPYLLPGSRRRSMHIE
jgi:hypothetical protein